MEDGNRTQTKDKAPEQAGERKSALSEEKNTAEEASFNRLRALVKKTAKDSVFRDLFQNPKYLLQLYQALHPEDQEVTEKTIEIVTIRNVLLDQLYNDLGFMVGNRLLILVEAQSTWTVNIIIRSLMYLAQTWQEYIESTGQNVFAFPKNSLEEWKRQ